MINKIQSIQISRLVERRISAELEYVKAKTRSEQDSACDFLRRANLEYYQYLDEITSKD